jgi:hypothetical protein
MFHRHSPYRSASESLNSPSDSRISLARLSILAIVSTFMLLEKRFELFMHPAA